jgi:hypothetical protein
MTGRFNPGKESPMWRGEKSWPYRDSNSDPSAIQPVVSRYTDCAIPAPMKSEVDIYIVTYGPFLGNG